MPLLLLSFPFSFSVVLFVFFSLLFFVFLFISLLLLVYFFVYLLMLLPPQSLYFFWQKGFCLYHFCVKKNTEIVKKISAMTLNFWRLSEYPINSAFYTAVFHIYSHSFFFWITIMHLTNNKFPNWKTRLMPAKSKNASNFKPMSRQQVDAVFWFPHQPGWEVMRVLIQKVGTSKNGKPVFYPIQGQCRYSHKKVFLFISQLLELCMKPTYIHAMHKRRYSMKRLKTFFWLSPWFVKFSFCQHFNINIPCAKNYSNHVTLRIKPPLGGH